MKETLWGIGLLIAKLYGWCFLATALIGLAFIVAIRMTDRQSQLICKLKFWLLIFYSMMTMGLLLPVFLLRPRNVNNNKISGWVMRKLNWVLELTWEVRNYERLQPTTGAVICSNHQSSLDVYVLIAKLYGWCFLATVLICLAFIIAIRMTDRQSQLLCKLKFWLLIFYSMMTMGLLLPVFLLRPRNVNNNKISGWVMRKLNWVLELTWELRNCDRLQFNTGAVICSNHQSSLDVYGMFNLWSFINRVTAIAKRELLYVVPFGPSIWLCGILFINRKSAKDSYRVLDETAQRIKHENLKLWIFPEGTRNTTAESMLPFKKGAFRTAINAQAPIIPLVVGPYYFLENKKFDKGHIVYSALAPIPTVGLSENDIDQLIERTRNVMIEEYEKLGAEQKKNLKNKEWRDTKRPRLALIETAKTK